MATLSKSEVTRRRRLVVEGHWDECWIVLSNGSEFFSLATTLVDDNIVKFVTVHGQVISDLDAVTSARH